MRRALLGVAVLTLLAASLTVAGHVRSADRASTVANTFPRSATVTAEWAEDGSDAPANTPVAGYLNLSNAPAGFLVTVSLNRAGFTSIPDRCAASNTITQRSFISASGHQLTCRLTKGSGPEPARIKFEALVTGSVGENLSGEVSSPVGNAPLTRRTIGPGPRPGIRRTRLLSSPDFLNADVGDLRHGPNFWTPAGTENSINHAYRKALSHVLSDWADQHADGVLVAGDLVEGWWGTDRGASGNFGPVDTARERRKALERAAATYYPQWRDRFVRHHLTVFPAMGDHEFGDDPWDAQKRALAPQFEAAFTKYMTRRANGSARFVDRPKGSKHEFSAYAWRPSPNVQMVTLNVFDVTDARTRIRLDDVQMRWLTGVLRAARRDGVQWVVVQGHVPIVGPVRLRGSTGLTYDGGDNSRLWKVFQRYGVDLYLCGEVHDVTAIQRDGVVQIAHGGAFQWGLTTYLLADFYDDHISLTLRDYQTHHADAADGRQLWSTRPSGLPKVLTVARTPFTIGTAVLNADGTFDPSGVLNPFAGGGPGQTTGH